MRAVRWLARQRIEVVEVSEPEPGPGEVKVAVSWCGICGSDVAEYAAGPILIPRRPHPLNGKVPPVTMGHEFAGTVVAVGAGVEGLRPGVRVTAEACVYCGLCEWCGKGRFNLCTRLGSIGLTWDGAFAPFVVIPAYTCYPLAETVTDEQGAFAEPLAVAVHACRQGAVGPETSVLVVGAGPIGLLTMQVAKTFGAAPVLVAEPHPGRAALARELGADAVLIPGEADVPKAVAGLTGGRRVDVALDCAGKPAALELALQATARGGRVVVVGIHTESVPVHPGSIVAYEKLLVGASAYTAADFTGALDLLAAGRIRTEELVTGRIPLARVPETIAGLAERPADHVKILVRAQEVS